MTWLRQSREPEVMDDPALPVLEHTHALRGLTRINRWSTSLRIVASPIVALARTNGRAPLRVLDVATGAGDVPIGLWRRASRAGVQLEIEGCDRSPTAIAYASAQAQRAGARIRFFAHDLFGDRSLGEYDVIVSSLFLHHLDFEQASLALARMAVMARHLLLINDLRRSYPGLCLAVIGTRLLSSSSVVHRDGPRSVRAAYTMSEAVALAHAADLRDARVVPRWPCRFLLTWHRP